MLVWLLSLVLLGLLAIPARGQVYERPMCAGEGDFPADAVSLTVSVSPSPIVLGDSVRVTYALLNVGHSTVAGCLSELPDARFAFSGAESAESEERVVVPDHPTCDPFVLPPAATLVWTRVSAFDGYPVGLGSLVGVVEPDDACPWRGEVKSDPVSVEVVSR